MKLRKYLLTSLIGLAGTLMSLSSVSLANEPAANVYTDGVYEGSAKGYANGITKVKVTKCSHQRYRYHLHPGYLHY